MTSIAAEGWRLSDSVSLRPEPFGANRGREVRIQHFDGDVPIVFQIVREIHVCHAAGTDFPFEAVAARQRLDERGWHVRHARRMLRQMGRPPGLEGRSRSR